MTAELGGTQFDNFESRFDGESDLTCRAARRTDLPWRAFGRADEAQPQASGRERRRDPCGKTRPLLGFIEDMKAAAVKDELERTPGRGAGEKVQSCEAAIEIALVQLRGSSFDRERGDIDAQDVKAALRQPKGIGPRTRADLQRPAWAECDPKSRTRPAAAPARPYPREALPLRSSHSRKGAASHHECSAQSTSAVSRRRSGQARVSRQGVPASPATAGLKAAMRSGGYG